MPPASANINPKHLDQRIWAIAWPAILSNISIPILGLVDAAILGHLSDPRYLGAVAIGGALLSFLYWGFGFLRMGTTSLVARAEGGGRADESRHVLLQSMVLALLIALALVIAHPLLFAAGFALMAPQESILPLAQSYAGIRIASAPAALITYAIVGWCIGRQDTRRPLLIVVATNLINIALDFLLIVGFGLSSDGAALATVIAEYCGCLIGIILVLRVYHRPTLRDWHSLRDWPTYRRLLRSNRDLFVRTICLLGSFAFFTAQGDKLGTEVLGANALMLQLLMLSAHAMDGFAFAAEGLSGQFLGAANLNAFYQAVRRCSLWTAVTAIVLSVLFWFGQGPLFNQLTDQAALLSVLHEHAIWLVLMPLAAGPSYLLDGVFIGAGATRQMMLTMLVSVFGVFLPLWYVCQGWGNHGLWLAFVTFNAARGLTLYYCYQRIERRGGWLRFS